MKELQAEIERLRGETKRLEHIVAVLKCHIYQVQCTAQEIEGNTRITNGRVEVWCLGEWVDVLKANEEEA